MKVWKKLLLCFVSIAAFCLSCIAVIMACSGEPDPYDYYTSFFHPDTQGKKDFGAFYFTDYRFTYSDEEPESEAAINANEWARYLGGEVKAADVEKIMYHLDSAGKEQVYHFFEQDPPVADSLAKSKFLWSLKDPSRAAARKYYQFALQAEMLGQSSYNYWEPAPLDTAGLKQTAIEAAQSGVEEDDAFLKLRYFYQAQKLYHYAGSYTEAKNIYDQYIAKTSSSSHVKGWALALKAGEERRLGDTTKAAYLFFKVFAAYPERRLQAYRNYHYINAPLGDVIKLARTPEEKANIYAIKSFANSQIGTDDLEQVYENAPASPLVGVLLVREINKLEQYYLTPALDNNNDQFFSNQTNNKATNATLEQNVAKWPLFISVIILIAGIALFIYAVKKQHTQATGKIAGVLLILIGVIGAGWFAFKHLSKQPAGNEPLPKGNFFVAVPDSVKTKYNAHIEKLRSFCTKLTSDAKYNEPHIGTLADAYLYFIQNRPDDGLSRLNDMEDKSISPKINDQRQIVALLLSAQRLKTVQAVDETALLPALQWLNKKVIAGGKPKRDVYPPTPDGQNNFAVTQRNFYNYVLAPAYLRQGDTTKAALVMLNSQNRSSSDYRDHMFKQMPDFWYNFLHAKHINQLISWKTQHLANPYLSFLTAGLKQIDYSALYELLGTVQLREHHYQEAAASFRNEKAKLTFARADEASMSDGDPFSITINDYAQPKTRGLTKLQFAERMAKLEAKLKADPKNADTYFQLATGLYHTSTYSNAWNMISYIWSSYDYGRKSIYYYDSDYIRASLAKQYYLKARDLSNDPEFKAQCTFMAAKCEQKEHISPWNGSYVDYDKIKDQEKRYLETIRKSSYFKEMQQFKNTAFYRKAVNECSYLSDFINSN